MSDSPVPRGVEEIKAILHSPRSAPSSPIASDNRHRISSDLPSPTKTSLFRSKSSRITRPTRRADSVVEPLRNNNKLSIVLPIQQSTSVAVWSPPSTTSPSPTKHIFGSSVWQNLPSAPSTSDSVFLTALAAQERRVLDIREELVRAEKHLNRLKREWASHEAHKKRQDARLTQRMQMLPSSAKPSAGSPTESYTPTAAAAPSEMPVSVAAATAPDLEKRRAMMSQGTSQRVPQRTVFTGHRHVRALSLLSPERSHVTTFADFAQSAPNTAHPDHLEAARPSSAPRAPTNQDLLVDVLKPTTFTPELGLPSDAIMRHGRQMASDLRDGLMTFIEDLRQVTVGEEQIRATNLAADPNATLQPGRTQPAEPSLWPEDRNKPRVIPTGKQVKKGKSDSHDTSQPLISHVDEVALKPVPYTSHCKRHSVRGSVTKSAARQTSADYPNSVSESWDNWDSPDSGSEPPTHQPK